MARITVIFLLAAATAAFGSREPNRCVTTIATAFPADAVRAEITAASKVAWAGHRKNAKLSPLRGTEAPFVPVRLATRGATHVVSLGSGADIFRPLYDFPAADEIHLVDTMSGWGKSPAAIFVEIAARLQAFPGAKVRVVERGFTRNMTAADICSRTRFVEKLVCDPYRLDPFVWEAEWPSAAAQTKLRRRVSLYAMNYHDQEDFPPMLRRLRESGAIVGVMVTGAWEPRGGSQEAILDALASGGAYVFETTGSPSSTVAPDPSSSQQQLFQQLAYTTFEARPDPLPRSSSLPVRTFVAVRR